MNKHMMMFLYSCGKKLVVHMIKNTSIT